MDFFSEHLLTIILFFPVIAALVIWVIPSDQVRVIHWTALLASLVPLGAVIYLWQVFDPNQAGFQFIEQYRWYDAINSSFKVGVDGLSLTMVLLTTILTPLALLASFNVTDRVKAYMMLFLFLEAGMLGVFLSMDLLIFFVFWEIGLVPMYFLINQWGSTNRNYASLKFIIYTMAGSLGLLLAIQLLGVLFQTYDIQTLAARWSTLNGTLMGIPVSTVKTFTFWAFVIAFAIKVPVWPFHTWLPDAHTEAPTAGSMLLAGVLLKLGAYGFLRLVLPFYPAESQHYAGWLAFLATMAIIFGAFGSYGQVDFKRLVAYSSINHMGFVLLGIAAAALIGFNNSDPALNLSANIALNGAVLQMFAHGLSAAGMFFLVGVIYERTHTRNLKEYGGLFPLIPVYGGMLIFTSMASLGLPGMAGFVAEFQVVRGTWPVLTVWTAISMLGLLMTGAYILKGIKLVLHGPLNEHWVGRLTEINIREIIVMAPLMVLILLIGIWPMWIMDVVNKAMAMLF